MRRPLSPRALLRRAAAQRRREAAGDFLARQRAVEAVTWSWERTGEDDAPMDCPWCGAVPRPRAFCDGLCGDCYGLAMALDTRRSHTRAALKLVWARRKGRISAELYDTVLAARRPTRGRAGGA